jgi:hypothetical protein
MVLFTNRTARAAGAAVTLLGAIALASPAFAASQEVTIPPASHQTIAMSSTAAEPAGMMSVETRIKDLHRKLHITAAQKPQWDDLTMVMRTNAQAMVDLEKQRTVDAQSMNAVDVVKSYESVIEAHEDGMKKFVPSFEALYDTMSDAQKKTADSLFRSREKASAAKQTASSK